MPPVRMRRSAADASIRAVQGTDQVLQALLRQMQVLIRQVQALSERVDTSERYIAAIVFANHIAVAASEIDVDAHATPDAAERAGA